MDKKDLAKKLITEFAKWDEKAYVKEARKQRAKRKRSDTSPTSDDVYVPGEFSFTPKLKRIAPILPQTLKDERLPHC